MEHDEDNKDQLLAEYGHAQEIALHSDSVFWEIASIVWGAETLLLGFVLEVPKESGHAQLVQITAVIGGILALVVLSTYYSSKIGQRAAFDACRVLEQKLETLTKLHHAIDRKYPRHFIRNVIWMITLAFVTAWAWVGFSVFRARGVAVVVITTALFALLLFIFWQVGLRKTWKEQTKYTNSSPT